MQSKLSLGVFPTPVHKLENISRLLGTQVYIKRDDLTGLGLGGNKVRKLEYLLAEAKAQGAQVVFTTGGAGGLFAVDMRSGPEEFKKQEQAKGCLLLYVYGRALPADV